MVFWNNSVTLAHHNPYPFLCNRTVKQGSQHQFCFGAKIIMYKKISHQYFKLLKYNIDVNTKLDTTRQSEIKHLSCPRFH